MTAVTVFDTPAELGAALAREIADGIADAAAAGREYVLGCPGGRSPRPVYSALAGEVRERGLDLGHLIIAMMDEYVLADGDRYRNVDARASFGCARFAAHEIAGPLALAAGSGRGPGQVWVPDAADPAVHERRITEHGIDLFVLASGSSDGHVGFNPPGTSRAELCRVVRLPDSTRRDNLATHPDFGTVENVPRFGVTVGPATIANCSARAVMIAHGPEKRRVAARLTAATTYESSWPATIIHECRSPAIYLDSAAVATE